MDLTWAFAVRLLLAGALGGVIGLERTRRHKAAGLRTNIFICGGTALFTILSQEYGVRYGGDHARIAAQIIPGIGFIGAGAILRDRGSVFGLTTAATIFMVASIGMAVGSGYYVTGIFATVLVVIGLVGLGWAEARYITSSQMTLFRIETGDPDKALEAARTTLEAMNVPLRGWQVRRDDDRFAIEFAADLLPKQQQRVLVALTACATVSEATCEPSSAW